MFPRRMMRRGIRRGVRRGFRRLSRAAVISMAGAATGVTLAAIASQENISKEEAEEVMDDLVAENVLRKEKKNGETVYVAATAAQTSGTTQTPSLVEPAATVASTKFCRQCGAKIPSESKFCEKCGAPL